MRRHRQYQHDLHEPIITLYLSLCVELKKGHAAKEGLYQYKILTQNTDINSLEKVRQKTDINLQLFVTLNHILGFKVTCNL